VCVVGALTLGACSRAPDVQAVAGGFHTMILKTDGTLWATGDGSVGQLGIGTITERVTPVQVILSLPLADAR